MEDHLFWRSFVGYFPTLLSFDVFLSFSSPQKYIGYLLFCYPFATSRGMDKIES